MDIKISERLESSTMQIFERLYKIAESASLEELDAKINTIMDALGLEDTETTAKEEPKASDEEKTEENTLVIEDTDDEQAESKPAEEDKEVPGTFTVGEDLGVAETKPKYYPYTITFLDSRGYSTDLDEIKGQFTDTNAISFETLDDAVNFLGSHGFIRYAVVNDVYEADESREYGIIYMTNWYEVVKNKPEEEETVVEEPVETIDETV